MKSLLVLSHRSLDFALFEIVRVDCVATSLVEVDGEFFGGSVQVMVGHNWILGREVEDSVVVVLPWNLEIHVVVFLSENQSKE